MTQEQITYDDAVIISLYTSYLMCDFSDMHKKAEKVMGHPIFTHEFSDPELRKSIKEKIYDEFVRVCKKMEGLKK